MADMTEKLVELEKRIRELSDQLEIQQLIAGYAPAFDGGLAERVADTFIEDGVFDVAGTAKCNNRAEILALARGDGRPEAQRQALANGAGHVLSAPVVKIDGDTAVATCTSQFYLRGEGAYAMVRLSAVRIELVRTDNGWRIARRLNQLIDDSGEGLAVYRNAF